MKYELVVLVIGICIALFIGFLLGAMAAHNDSTEEENAFLQLWNLRTIAAYLSRFIDCDRCPVTEDCRGGKDSCPDILADHLLERLALSDEEGDIEMYILFECSSSDKDKQGSFEYMDAMGYATTEEAAMGWRDANPEYRAYKYCSNKEIKFKE